MALTRDQMVAVIEQGGSVLHAGRLITRVEHLPTVAELAAGDPVAEAAAAARLQEQIAQLQAQVAHLQAQAAEPTVEPPAKKADEKAAKKAENL